MERLGFGKLCPPLVMCGVELQVCRRCVLYIVPLCIIHCAVAAMQLCVSHALQLLSGSSANDLVSFGLPRKGAEELAAAVDRIADMEKWMELQVTSELNCDSYANLCGA